MTNTTLILVKTSLFFAPVITEIFIFRWFFHYKYGTNLLNLGIHATDIYLPFFVVMIVLFVRLQRKAPFEININRPIVVLHVLSLALFFAAFLVTSAFGSSFELISFFTLMTIGGLSTISSVFLFFKWEDIFFSFQKLGKGRINFMVAILALLNYPFVLEYFWRPLAYATAKSVAFSLSMMGISVTWLVNDVWFTLWHPDFAANMVMGCSGLEGIFFFIFTYALIRCTSEKESIEWEKQPWIAYPLGCLLMFLLNILRITLLFALAIYIEHHIKQDIGRVIYEEFFHRNMGWIIYGLGIAWFLYVLPTISRWVFKKYHSPL